jgi:TATA-box binding protein (TBP) (component of TFIID and TFIIIB)
MEFIESIDLNKEWLNYLNICDVPLMKTDTKEIKEERVERNIIPPKCSPIIISTKTKIIYLNMGIILFEHFWDMPMISYDSYGEGIIKKQIKFNFKDKEEVLLFEEKIKEQTLPTVVRILNQIDNPSGRVKFKDIRKVDIGISKNDIIKTRNKDKSAFYNCFVFIYRIKLDGKFKEIHIKLFNSGKIEIPGIQDESILDKIILYVIQLLQPHYSDTIYEKKEMRETILINSNFKCNYFINRDELFTILKTKYNIKCSYDPCSYPGIQCKYKLPNVDVSFMIFRTGSVLIVGKCDDDQLYIIYEFIKKIFIDEINSIYENDNQEQPKKIKKKVKKIIYI